MGARLYVGNLPFSVDEDQIRALFEQDGRVVQGVRLITDRDTGRPRGFGFVEMENQEQADTAIRTLNGQDFGGRSLTVNEAKERTQRPRRDDFGGGGGGYRNRF